MKSFIVVPFLSWSRDIKVKVTSLYVEVRYPIGDDAFFYLYFIPKSEDSLFVMCCWDKSFDFVFGRINFDDIDRKSVRKLTSDWPNLGNLISNGIKKRFKKGAVLPFIDPDDRQIKWVLAASAEKLNADKPERFKKTLNDAIGVMMNACMPLLSDILGETNYLAANVKRKWEEGTRDRAAKINKAVEVVAGALPSIVGILAGASNCTSPAASTTPEADDPADGPSWSRTSRPIVSFFALPLQRQGSDEKDAVEDCRSKLRWWPRQKLHVGAVVFDR